MAPPVAPLAIALDASLWDEPTTGIALYARHLSTALEREGVRVRRLGARTSGDAPRGDVGSTVFTLGRLPALLQEAGEPLFHALGNFNLPLTRVPGKRLVLTVHDLIPLLMPATVSVAYRWQFRVWLARSLKVADRIICISERTRKDLLAAYDVDESKVGVVHHGVDHVDNIPLPDTTGEAFLRSLALPAEFVLYAGSLDLRKNVVLLLDAVARLKAEGRMVTAVLVGQRWFGAEKAEARLTELKASGCDIRLLDYQSEPIFYALMRRAAVFVFPSLHEGFGLPPLEAMRLGVPVVSADTGALPEVLGDAPAWVKPDDPVALAAVLKRLLTSPEERRSRISAGRRRAAAYSWETAARKTMEFYRQALTEPEPSA